MNLFSVSSGHFANPLYTLPLMASVAGCPLLPITLKPSLVLTAPRNIFHAGSSGEGSGVGTGVGSGVGSGTGVFSINFQMLTNPSP